MAAAQPADAAVSASEGVEQTAPSPLDALRARFLESKDPQAGLDVARAFVSAGRWLEAADIYGEVQSLGAASRAPARSVEAGAVAANEREQLFARFPAVIVTTDRDVNEAVRVFVNGAQLGAHELGVRRLVDPGTVRVRGVLDGTRIETILQLREGETKPVRLTFAADDVAEVLPPRAAPPQAPARVAVDDGGSSTQRVVAYVALGIGSAVLLTGGVFGIVALRDEASLKSRCPQNRCAPAVKPDVDAYESKKTIATIGILSGAALAAGGAVLYLTSPSGHQAPSRVGAFCDGQQAGVWGTF